MRHVGADTQFTGLEELHKEYADKGLVVLGFPSNEFAGQDPGTDEDIASFCQVRRACFHWILDIMLIHSSTTASPSH